jgi:hypothetical protein
MTASDRLEGPVRTDNERESEIEPSQVARLAENRLAAKVITWAGARSLWVGGAAVAAAPFFNSLLATSVGPWRWVLSGGLAVVALFGFAVPAAKAREAQEGVERARQETAATEARILEVEAEIRVAVSDVLLPVLSFVVEGCLRAARADRQTCKAGAIPMILASAAQVCHPANRARACWYELEASGDEYLQLVPRQHFGRGSRPTTVFSTETARGVELLRLITQEEPELYRDLNQLKPDHWQPSRRRRESYSTFLAVPVRAAGKAFGILMVDVDEVGSLTEEDTSIVRVLGWILALALLNAELDDHE